MSRYAPTQTRTSQLRSFQWLLGNASATYLTGHFFVTRSIHSCAPAEPTNFSPFRCLFCPSCLRPAYGYCPTMLLVVLFCCYVCSLFVLSMLFICSTLNINVDLSDCACFIYRICNVLSSSTVTCTIQLNLYPKIWNAYKKCAIRVSRRSVTACHK